MDDRTGQEVAHSLRGVEKELRKGNHLQEDANELMRSLIPALQAVAQELADSRKQEE